MATSAITTYMNDHLGGSAAAVELLDRLIERARTPQDATFYADIRTEVEADRSTLTNLIKRLGGTPSVIREAGGWLGAKVANLKLRLEDRTGGDLERLEAHSFAMKSRERIRRRRWDRLRREPYRARSEKIH